VWVWVWVLVWVWVWVCTYAHVVCRWAKFFLPVYEKDRVYMLKCGDSPTMGYLDDDDW
jgi:hypothetical protein